ncbi:MAG: DUF2304 domain-containing protein [Candidatus Omnitrophota bacterium]
MTMVQKILILILSVFVLAATVELIRRRKLREEYALLWLLTGAVILVFAIFPQLLYLISRLLGLHHLTTMLLISFLFLLCIVLHFSTVISKLTDRETELAQQLALLEQKLKELKKQSTTEPRISQNKKEKP